MIFQSNNKMCDLMGVVGTPYGSDGQVLQLLNRFGISMGVGEKTIAAVCDEQDIDCETFLAIVNYAINKEIQSEPQIDIDTLHRYLENAHAYFLNFQLPRIRQELLQALNLAQGENRVPLMIIQYFDEYVQEIRAHIEHEKEHSYEQHEYDDKHVAAKARELKNLIIKYYPKDQETKGERHEGHMQLLYAVLHDLHHFEQELALHCAIEDEIMLPAITKKRKSTQMQSKSNATEMDELSAREIEVLKQVALGMSNKEIADVLCLSAHTVMSHRKNIVRKLGIHTTAGLTIYAVVNNIIEL